jgi:hypothetical protein
MSDSRRRRRANARSELEGMEVGRSGVSMFAVHVPHVPLILDYFRFIRN